MYRTTWSAVAITGLVVASFAMPTAVYASTSVTEITTVGSSTWTVPAGVTQVDVLIVGGGGGGGGHAWGGGGGAGGVLYGSCIAVTPGASIPVVVGAGGAGGDSTTTTTNMGVSGASSSFGSATAVGGGGGGGYAWDTSYLSYAQRGLAGGSGGGHGELPGVTGFMLGAKSTQTAPSGYAAYGNSAGTSTGQTQSGSGGGGAGAAGGAVLSYAQAGAGGAGKAFDISGASVVYAGGGGGGGGSNGQLGGVGGSGGGGTGGTRSIPATDAVANTGSGGGGAGPGTTSGDGGSGIVIVRAHAEGDVCTTDAQRVAVNVVASANGAASSSPTFVDANGTVTLAAEAIAGQSFVSWSCTDGSLSSSTANPATLTGITADTTCTARFSGDPVGPPPLAFTLDSLPTGKVNEPYSEKLSATGGADPATFAVTDGDLPPGMSLSSDGSLTGTPTEAGTFTITITATSGDQTVDQTVTITIDPAALAFTVDELPKGQVNEPYDQTLTTDGGAEPPTFAVTDGELPPGLTLGDDGTITGTPTEAGDYTMTITATSGEESAEVTLTMTIEAATFIDDPGAAIMAFTGLASDPNLLVGAAAMQVAFGLGLMGLIYAYRRRIFAPNRALIRWTMLHPTVGR